MGVSLLGGKYSQVELAIIKVRDCKLLTVIPLLDVFELDVLVLFSSEGL